MNNVMTGSPAGRPATRVRRAPRSVSPPPDRGSHLLQAAGLGVLAALVGVAAVVLLGTLAWAVSPHGASSSIADAARVSAGVWLLAHRVGLNTAVGAFQVAPVGWTVLPVALTWLAGRRCGAVVTTWQDAARTVSAVAGGYGASAAVVAVVGSGDGVRVPWPPALVLGALVAAAGSAVGVVRAAGLWHQFRPRVPEVVRDAAPAGLAALLVLLAMSSLVAAVMLAVGWSDGAQMASALSPDALGTVALVLAVVGFVPNLVVWATAFLAGPGFAIGTTGQVSMQAVEYGPLPVFPPLAALPPPGDPGPFGLVGLVAPAAAGVLAGWLLHRSLGRTAEVPDLVVRCAVAGGVPGGAVAVLAWWTSGAAGSGALSRLGASPLVGLLVAVEVGVAAGIVAGELRRRT